MQMKPVLGHDEALAAIDAIRAELVRQGRSAVVAVADDHGELLALLRLDGAAFSSVTVASNKAWTAARLRRPTREVLATLHAKGTDIAFYGDPRYTGFGGGVPAFVGKTVVGAVAVSGLSDDEDEALAALGIAAMMADRSARAR
jgi:glc operon protein GlcG